MRKCIEVNTYINSVKYVKYKNEYKAVPGDSENFKYRNIYFQACDFQADIDMLPDGIFTEVLHIK